MSLINNDSKRLIQTARYQSAIKQPIKGLQLYAPTIIWVEQGQKRLWWRENELKFTPFNWLVIPASQKIAFINDPCPFNEANKNGFSSRSLSFYHPPPEQWVFDCAQGSNHLTPQSMPQIQVSASLGYCFDLLFEMNEKNLSHETQKQLLLGFYAELKNAGALHLLFPHSNPRLSERLAHHLSFEPGENHSVCNAAKHFSMSRATFIRKLAAEKTAFRQVLINVRMLYSLTLMQKSSNLFSIALSCGYQSPVRFSNRFKCTFGLTPRQYLKTINAKKTP